MTRPHARRAVVACLLALAGCGATHSQPATSGATRRASTTRNSDADRGEHAVAAVFAAAYVRLLDGVGAVSGLPDTTSSVRALAARAGSIPAARRRGTLLITALRPAAGAANRYLLTVGDDAHTFYAQITLSRQRGHWLVVDLTPPDFVQVFAPGGPPPPVPPPGSAGAQTAVRRFVRGYLPWLYEHASLHAITAATPGLLADLRGHPPRVPSTMRSLRPKIAAIAMQRHRRGWQALPNISDGHETYELVLTITHTRRQWLVTNVSSQTR